MAQSSSSNPSPSPSPSSSSSLLPPLSSLPTPIYPPSTYAPIISHFDSLTLIHPALIIPAKRTGEIQRTLGELVFCEPKRKRVYPLEEGLDYVPKDLEGGYDPKKERKLVLNRLGPAAKGGSQSEYEVKKDSVWNDARLQSMLESATKSESSNDNNSEAPPGKSSIRPSSISLPATPYSLLTVDQVLRQIMPTADDACPNGNPTIEEIPSSFEIAGHIAHVNLRSESLPYKYLIGKAILDKNSPKIKVVVNKIGNIENEFRTFPMEIIAGEGLDLGEVERLCAAAPASSDTAQDEEGNKESGTGSSDVQIKIGPQHQSLMQVEVKEHGCRFQLDFARVYFNSRLQGEHDRLVQHIVQDAKTQNRKNDKKKECIVADAMAGVGPFAIPLTSANAPHYTSTKIICYANDLNPTSYEYLVKNARLNKCYSDRLKMYNLDARVFIHKMNKMNEEGVEVDHFIMNLPQLGPEFLDAFRGWKFAHGDQDGGDKKEEEVHRPMVHVHCFGEKAKGPDETARVECQVRERCETALGSPDCLLPEENEFQVRVVRDVGPRKNMLCVSFRLPVEVGGVDKLMIANNGGGTSGGGTDGDAALSNGKRSRAEEEEEGTAGAASGSASTSCKRNKES